MYFCNKRGGLVVVLFLIVLLIPSIVTSFGISTPYIENNTLKVTPGNTYVYTITVQNGDSSGYFVDMTHNLNEFVRLDEYTRYVESKTYNTTFQFIINVPQDAKSGEEHNLEYSAKPRVEGEGTINMGVELKRNIKIQITEQESNIPFYTGNLKIIKNLKSFDSKNIYKYSLIILSIIIIIFVAKRIWKISQKISTKIHSTKEEKKTISESKTLKELYNLLDEISDEEFDLKAIRNITKQKLHHLNQEGIYHHVPYLSRKELLEKLKSKIKHEK